MIFINLNILDLFSGSGSWVKNWYNNFTYNICIDSVDIVKRPHINYVVDVKNFKANKEYHIVYASPPCNNFSKIKQINKKKTTKEEMELSLKLVEIAFKFGKKAKLCYVIENPATGLLPLHYPDYQLVDYSEYGYPLRKRTAIWSNIDLKLKVRKKGDVNYNTYPLSYLSTDEKWEIPKKLTDRIKWMIIKKFTKELMPFRKIFIPGLKNSKFPISRSII